MKIRRVARLAVLCAASCIALKAFAAFEPFVVRNFRVEGAQRIAEGTIYNYLPINIGDTVDEQRLREAGRALFGVAADLQTQDNSGALFEGPSMSPTSRVRMFPRES